MVKEMEGSWRGVERSWSPREQCGARHQEPSRRGFLMEHKHVRLPARDFQPLFITETAKESWSRIPECFEDL